MGLLGRFFKGSLTWEYMWKLTFKELLFYYNNYELQATEEEVVSKHKQKVAEKKISKMPKYEAIREEVDSLIEKRRQEINGKVESF